MDPSQLPDKAKYGQLLQSPSNPPITSLAQWFVSYSIHHLWLSFPWKIHAIFSHLCKYMLTLPVMLPHPYPLYFFLNPLNLLEIALSKLRVKILESGSLVSWVVHLLTVWAWTRYLTSLCPTSCKMGIMIVLILQMTWELNELNHVKLLKIPGTLSTQWMTALIKMKIILSQPFIIKFSNINKRWKTDTVSNCVELLL